MSSTDSSNEVVITRAVISSLFSLLFLSIALNVDESSFLYFLSPSHYYRFGNIITYLISGAVAVISFMIMQWKGVKIKESKLSNVMILILSLVCLILICDLAYDDVNKIMILAIILLVSFSIIILLKKTSITVPCSVSFILSIVMALLCAISIFASNTFGETIKYGAAVNVHHSSAYIDSIYNVFYLQPFIGDLTDQYGHYALYYYPLLKIVGFSTYNISIIMGIITIISFLLLAYSAHKLIKNKTLLIFCIICMGVILSAISSLELYWQFFPHRILFPSLIIAYISKYYKKDEKKLYLGLLICINSLIWNFETGVATTACFSFFVLITTVYNEKKWLKGSLQAISIMVVSFMIPYFIVNGYNLIVTDFNTSSFMSIRLFLGSITDMTYVGVLETKWVWANDIVFYLIVLLLCCFICGLPFGKGTCSDDSRSLSSISICILALLSYGINRTLAGTGGTWCFCVLIACVAVDLLFVHLKDFKLTDISSESSKYLCHCISLLLIVGLSMSLVISAYVLPDRLESRVNGDCFAYDDFVSFSNYVGEHTDENTAAFGEGTTAIYSVLNRDKQEYSFFLQYDDVITNTIEKYDHVLIYSGYVRAVPPDYILIETFSYKNCDYYYYQRGV